MCSVITKFKLANN